MKHYTLALLLVALAVPLHAQQPQTLHEAAKKGDVDSTRALISKGGDVHTRDRNGNTPLHVAARYGYVELVRALTGAGADVNARDNAGITPLHLAARLGYAPAEMMARILLRNTTVSGSVTLKDQSNDENGEAEAAHEINWSGADADALSEADTVRTLIEAGADVNNASNKAGVTPLHAAAMNDDVEVVADAIRAMIEAGANVNAEEIGGLTPLHVAAYEGHAEAVRALTVSGADVNAKNKDGYTPLSLATGKGHADVVRALCAIDGIEDAGRSCPTPVSRPNPLE